MNSQNQRESAYEIEPWNEQPSQIPCTFLKSHNFAKTSFVPKQSYKSQKNLQIATNSVYFIKHHHEEDTSQPKNKTRYHRTTEGSPKFQPKENCKKLLENKIRSNMISATRSTSKLLKKKQKNPESKTPFQHNKNIVFQMKPVNKRVKQERETIFSAKSQKQALNRNLLKIYERSTVTNDQKKLSRVEKAEIDDICLRRKLKTDKEKQIWPDNLKNIAIMTEKSTVMSKNREMSKSKLQFSKGSSFQRSRSINIQQKPQKLKFELLMERKLYLMKNSVGKQNPFSPKKT